MTNDTNTCPFDFEEILRTLKGKRVGDQFTIGGVSCTLQNEDGKLRLKIGVGEGFFAVDQRQLEE